MARVNPNISYASIVSGNFKTENLSLLPPTKNYTLQSPYKQYFSLPYDVMKYILKNPKSPNGLLKLYKTCKYFYLKNQIVVPSVKLEFTSNGSISVSVKSTPEIFKPKKAQLWFTNNMVVFESYPFNLSNIYRSTIKCLCVLHSNIDLEKFKTLTSETLVEKFILRESIIRDSNGKSVSVDAILQLMPKLKKLFYRNIDERFSSETLQNMASLKFQNKFGKIIIFFENLAETFDPKLFFKFIKQNASPKKCFINLICTGENADVIKMNLKSAEKEIFPKEEKSEMFQIYYNRPYDYI